MPGRGCQCSWPVLTAAGATLLRFASLPLYKGLDQRPGSRFLIPAEGCRSGRTGRSRNSNYSILATPSASWNVQLTDAFVRIRSQSVITGVDPYCKVRDHFVTN